jgi:hypothetical protein
MQSVSSHPARRWSVLALIALLGLAVTFTASSASSASPGHAVAAKKKCKKKHKSAASAKKKKCKKKKHAVVPPVTTPAPPSNPTPPAPTLRGSLSFDDVSTDADLDLYVWDAEGNLAWFDDDTGIPDAFTTSNSPSPEQFFDQRSPSTREFTYGVCAYDDGDDDDLTDTEVDYTLDAPGGPSPFSDSDSVIGTGDWVLYVGPFDPDPGNTGNWCIDSNDPI